MELVAFNEKQKAIVKHAQSSYKKGKRPAQVLDEDIYVDSLSHIIKRDFFPGLETHSSSQIEDSRHSGSIRPSSTRMRTPHFAQEVTTDEAPGNSDKRPASSLSLDRFQARYTSEDNASFQEILDEGNLARREKYSWLYKDNKTYSVNTEYHEERQALQVEAQEKQLVKSSDRQSIRHSHPRNALMFTHTGLDPDDEQSLQVSHQPQINHAATALPDATKTSAPGSPSASLIERAIQGDVEPDEPHVGGFTFVATPLPQAQNRKPFEAENQTRGGAFKLPEAHPHEATLDRLTRDIKRKGSQTPKASPLARLSNATPKFKSSPVVRRSMLTPAASRMLGKQGSSSLRDSLTTPKTRPH
ncbi:nuclear protein Es2-domain-containing protein [Protomyces lactucae-debilis]|uniref:Nuclear protein Es2-domain-containing protein n=1 Tax=Protomyces lactucae-debilis TaxID=2754530 RepID=A0A1Y2F7J1_PROLT|nr:nuclear protein Es2-domain-containing protein [Protomyces lactucae-debilis]ORY79872.1 nuclear protein Es2-domain-containing protein [Protomyces lactucae-debilis]